MTGERRHGRAPSSRGYGTLGLTDHLESSQMCAEIVTGRIRRVCPRLTEQTETPSGVTCCSRALSTGWQGLWVIFSVVTPRWEMLPALFWLDRVEEQSATAPSAVDTKNWLTNMIGHFGCVRDKGCQFMTNLRPTISSRGCP